MTHSEQSACPEAEQSEFGRGIVVCLAKFSEHLQEHGPFSERMIREYAAWTPEEERRCRAEAQRHPQGDAAHKLSRMSIAAIEQGTREERISHLISMWMNGASDHFYDLDESAPQPLRELAALVLRIGHGFTDETWTMATIDRIRELWQESCLALDRQLGVEPDWGSW